MGCGATWVGSEFSHQKFGNYTVIMSNKIDSLLNEIAKHADTIEDLSKRIAECAKLVVQSMTIEQMISCEVYCDERKHVGIAPFDDDGFTLNEPGELDEFVAFSWVAYMENSQGVIQIHIR